jgi:hypothetical protein
MRGPVISEHLASLLMSSRGFACLKRKEASRSSSARRTQRGFFIVGAPDRQFRSPSGWPRNRARLQLRRQLRDELVAVTDGGVDVRGDPRDQRVDPGEDAAEFRVGCVRQVDDGLAGGMGERLDVDDLGVQGLESLCGAERMTGGVVRCIVSSAVWLRHGDLLEIESVVTAQTSSRSIGLDRDAG